MPSFPSIFLYPGDWLRDQVSGCSMAAQGLWLRMMFLMHDSEKYGYLLIEGKPMDPATIARRCGCGLEEYTTLFEELKRNGVPRFTPEGIIYSKRMVEDAKLRTSRAKAGSYGGKQSRSKTQAKGQQRIEDEIEDEKETETEGGVGEKEPSVQRIVSLQRFPLMNTGKHLFELKSLVKQFGEDEVLEAVKIALDEGIANINPLLSYVGKVCGTRKAQKSKQEAQDPEVTRFLQVQKRKNDLILSQTEKSVVW